MLWRIVGEVWEMRCDRLAFQPGCQLVGGRTAESVVPWGAEGTGVRGRSQQGAGVPRVRQARAPPPRSACCIPVPFATPGEPALGSADS